MQITLLEIDTTNIIVYIIGVIISWAIFYYTIKAAVKNGMMEANETKVPIKNNAIDKGPNSRQVALQKKYDAGELPFEEYKKEWDRLK